MKDHDIKTGGNARSIARWILALAIVAIACGLLAWFFFKKMGELGI